jgi:hypothetical protein
MESQQQKNNFYSLFTIAFFLVIMSCVDNNDKKQNTIIGQSNSSADPQAKDLSMELLGCYQGIQPSYFMKNQYGDDMVINGNKVSVPSIDYKFILKEDNVVNLQQINLENNNQTFYEGTFKIISNENETIKMECSLSDGKNSNPTYILTLNKKNEKGVCIGNNEPGFSINKTY